MPQAASRRSQAARSAPDVRFLQRPACDHSRRDLPNTTFRSGPWPAAVATWPSELRRYPVVQLTGEILHAAARITRGARRRQLKFQASWPWAAAIVTAWNRISALANAP
jgi:hypothetical protein